MVIFSMLFYYIAFIPCTLFHMPTYFMPVFSCCSVSIQAPLSSIPRQACCKKDVLHQCLVPSCPQDREKNGFSSGLAGWTSARTMNSQSSVVGTELLHSSPVPGSFPGLSLSSRALDTGLTSDSLSRETPPSHNQPYLI